MRKEQKMDTKKTINHIQSDVYTDDDDMRLHEVIIYSQCISSTVNDGWLPLGYTGESTQHI